MADKPHFDGDLKTINGRRYRFVCLDVWWQGQDREFGSWRSLGDNGPGAVICECGNDKFTISYGEYECLGHCSCGAVHELYTG